MYQLYFQYGTFLPRSTLEAESRRFEFACPDQYNNRNLNGLRFLVDTSLYLNYASRINREVRMSKWESFRSPKALARWRLAHLLEVESQSVHPTDTVHRCREDGREPTQQGLRRFLEHLETIESTEIAPETRRASDITENNDAKPAAGRRKTDPKAATARPSSPAGGLNCLVVPCMGRNLSNSTVLRISPG